MYRPLFHISVVAINSFTLWYDQKYFDIPFPAKGYEELPYKGRTMFLTYWCLLLQTVYFSISFINDLIGTPGETPRHAPFIRKLKDHVFGLAFPTALFVCVFFWAIYQIDKELIFPAYVAKLVPFWANAVLHIFALVFIVIELLVTKIFYPSRKVGLTLLAVFNGGYLTWMHSLQQRTGKWPYPIFELMTPTTRNVFLVINIVIGIGFYFIGEKLSSGRSTSKSQANGTMKSQSNGVHKKNY